MRIDQEHIMVDIESLSLSTRSAIVEVALVKFSPVLADAGVEPIIDILELIIDPFPQIALGRHVEDDTLKWWRESPEKRVKLARLLSCHEPYHPGAAVVAMRDFIGARPLWGNGATFDNINLKTLAQDVGLDWLGYRQDMCYKTWREMFKDTITENEFPEDRRHSAKADACHQVEHLLKIFAKIRYWEELSAPQ